jgi:hypothetical protein
VFVRYVVNVNGEALKLKGVNLEFIASSSESMNPLNGVPPSKPSPPPPVKVEHVPDLFSFDSNSPLHKTQSNNKNGGGDESNFGGGDEMKTGDDRAAAVRARYESMKKEQESKGVLEWDPVEERYREKVCTHMLHT